MALAPIGVFLLDVGLQLRARGFAWCKQSIGLLSSQSAACNGGTTAFSRSGATRHPD